ncbi:unnamed protein product [Pneumocystis jirovecii]|uniref:Uncharacterized protein n=1 Tax=Pneumocystis jirovecii TaxID=42068 RepID=L0P9J0_PNEJI|nr:unnamed protein product [Pneumocystis jirovecii]
MTAFYKAYSQKVNNTGIIPEITLNRSMSIHFPLSIDKNKKKRFTSSGISYKQHESYNDFGSLSVDSLQHASSCQALPSSPSCDIKIRLSELSTYVPSKKSKLLRKSPLFNSTKKKYIHVSK